MADTLEVFKDGSHIGRFTRSDDQIIRFVYDDDAPPTPISLSLPRDGQATSRAAANLLNNLLPDNEDVRGAWSRRLGVPNRPFDLLSRMGEDVAGALVLLPEGHSLSDRPSVAQPASIDEIADRIASITRNPSAWLAPELIGTSRMSLAGAQGKFTLAQVGESWFWSSATLPSTHIFKPALSRLEQVPEIEAGSLELARRAGIPAPRAEATEFLGQRTYVTERFDRQIANGRIRRVHTEDFAQAQGRPPSQKYGTSARQMLDIMRRHASKDEMCAFIRMLSFNTALGNTDAHAKNYSIFLDDGVRLTPLYDSNPTMIWPQLSEDRLAMPISGALRPQQIQPGHWAKLARVSGLDPIRVVGIAQDTATVVLEQFEDAFTMHGVSSELISEVAQLFTATTKNMVRA